MLLHALRSPAFWWRRKEKGENPTPLSLNSSLHHLLSTTYTLLAALQSSLLAAQPNEASATNITLGAAFTVVEAFREGIFHNIIGEL